MSPRTDLVVFSHLRWDWVWQRPQHLISRVGSDRTVWFVEEPIADPAATSTTVEVLDGPVRIVRAVVPGSGHVGFDHPSTSQVSVTLTRLLRRRPPVAWLYTPLALAAADALEPGVVVYDVMDDLAAFSGASPAIVAAHAAALRAADVVFTGGRSLHEHVASQFDAAECFPSGVEPEHYLPSRALRELRRAAGADRSPTVGYVGVIDERVDLGLVASLADALDDWTIEMVGPVAKIDAASLPQRPNLRWMGPATYADLPGVMARFDVGLMPFAMNAATRRISPTKTLEYLAAGLPVVSTPITDVVRDFGGLVHVAADATTFTHACSTAVRVPRNEREVARRLRLQSWDAIASSMLRRIEAVEAVMEKSA